MQVEQTGNVTVYILKGEHVGQYLHKVYGETVTVPENKQEAKLREVDIFGADWKGEFGFPFDQAALEGQELNLGKFDCLNPSAAEKGSGKITAINADSIEVEGLDGDHVKLQLGACTRLESGGSLPQVGEVLYWKGVKNEDAYNLHVGT